MVNILDKASFENSTELLESLLAAVISINARLSALEEAANGN